MSLIEIKQPIHIYVEYYMSQNRGNTEYFQFLTTITELGNRFIYVLISVIFL